MTKKRLIAGIMIVAVAGPAGAVLAEDAQGDTAAALSAMNVRAFEANMRFLADDRLEGRAPGTDGHEVAARFMADRFRELGLAPGGENGSYFQQVPIRRSSLENETPTLVFEANNESVELTYGKDFVVRGDPVLEQNDLTAPVVFVGYGVSAPELGYDDYDGVNVEGRIVAYLTNAPDSFPNDQRAYYASSRTKRANAASRGAVGVLSFVAPRQEKRTPWDRVKGLVARPAMKWLGDGGEPEGVFRRIRGTAVLNRSGVEQLLAHAPGSAETIFSSALLAQPQSFETGIVAHLRAKSRHRDITSSNVVALLRGSDPVLANEYVVFVAHLDHLGVVRSADGDEIYNGAYDNASGSALLIEIARAFAALPRPSRRSILFLAPTAEEWGLLGSDYFANRPTVPIGGIVAALNIDLAHMFHALHDFIAFGQIHSTLGEVVQSVARDLKLAIRYDPFPERVAFIRSDHYSFIRRGVPAVSLFPGFRTGLANGNGMKLFTNWMKNVYHTPRDDLSQHFDFDAGIQLARLNFLVGYRVAEATVRPAWNDGDFFGDLFAAQETGR